MGEKSILLFITVLTLAGAEVPTLQVVVPQGIESVNGSDITMRCGSPLVNRSGEMVCNNSDSYLVDGCSPAIDTSTSNWASQLVTVSKKGYEHVLLTFVFDTAVSLQYIELDMFLCPEWGIGSGFIYVYANENSGFVFSDQSTRLIVSHDVPDSQSSCDSLLTVNIPLVHARVPYTSWHIVVEMDVQEQIEWFHVGEVRFLPSASHVTITVCTYASVNSSSTFLSTSIPVTTDVISSSVHTFLTDTPPTPIDSPPTSSKSPSLSGTMVTAPTPTSRSTVPISGTDSVEIVKILIAVGALIGGLILLVLIIFGICCFIHCHPSKSIPNNSIELVKFQNANVGEKVDHENLRNDTTFYEPTADNSESIDPCLEDITNPIYSVTEDLYEPITTEDMGGGGGNKHYAVPKETPAPPLPKQRPSKVGKSKVESASAHDLPVYSDVQKNIPGVPPKSSALLKYLASQDDEEPSTSMMDPPPVKMSNHDAMKLGCTNENPFYERSDLLSFQPATQPINIINPTPCDGGHTFQPTAPPIEEVIYDDAVSPPVHTSDDNNVKEEVDCNPHIIDPIYDDPKVLPKDLQQPVEITNDNITELRKLGNGKVESAAACVIYDDAVSPPIRTSDDNKELVKEEVDCNPHIIDPIYDDPKVLPKDLQQPVEITNDNITEIRELGNGNFGKVMLAATRGVSLKDLKLSKTDDNRDISILVAVKKLIDNPSKTQRESFMKEVKFMSSLKHQNVVSLIGVCYDEPGFMMMEYMKEGDLSQFLQRYTEIVETPSNKAQISTSTLVYMASQIASAMKYLASLNFIHRDIASRNCLVGNNYTVKLADFGMSRNLYESHYYQIQGKTSVPVRWMATECFYGQFSEKSDVWAFGVTMWELFILAKDNPYSNLTNEELIHDVSRGANRQLLHRPSVCPVPMYNIMKRCWAADPKERVNFIEVDQMLQAYMAST